MLSAGKGNSPKRFKFPAAVELRSQLNDQLRALDGRVDNQTAILTELQDWYRRRAELHHEYASKLDKFTKALYARSKEQKLKRDQWNLFSVVNCHQVLLNQTRKDARDQYAMADVYLNNIVPRFAEVQDDIQRIFKKCRDIGYESHEELLKVLHELHTTMRTYHTYQADFKNAEGKLQNFEAQKAKLEKSIPKEKLEKSKKFRAIVKEIQKRNNKYIDAKMKALKARNEYILSMDSANAAIHKYFVEDLSDVIDCMDFGFHSSIARAILTHINGQECLKRTVQGGIDDLNKSINNLDSRHDKQRFLEFNNAAFMLPKKFEFQNHKEDEVNHILVTKNIQEEIEKRYALLSNRLTTLKTESEETWKTIETAEKTLMEMTNTRDYDIAHYFTDEVRVDTKEPESSILKRKADRQETEAFYLAKFREYTLLSNLICRLEARFDPLRKALGNETKLTASPTPSRNPPNKARRRRIGRTPLMGQPRLFGGSLEEYLEATGQEIPLIMKSCIRVINLYGLHHQGIFRVSGSQLEINNFRESFERMDDPLADVIDASDINSVAGVFKLYLRELREPIFPTVYFEQFMEIAQLDSKQEFVGKLRDVALSLPRPVFVVMRYLFSFLNHLSEFSDENMMDPYNLAICFGPTLVPIPEDKDQVQYQNLVNDLIKNIIIFSEDIFPGDGGTMYEKYISTDCLDLEAEIGYAPVDDIDSTEVDLCPSEDESEILEAIAQFDFKSRSERELSFKKGDLLLLHNQVSSDWWKGMHRGRCGLIPDKYILLKIRDDDKEKTPDCSKRRSSCSSESQISTFVTSLEPNHEGSPTHCLKKGNMHSQSLHAYETEESYDSESNSPTPSYNSSISSSLPSDCTQLTGDTSPLQALSTATLSQTKEEPIHRSTSFNQDIRYPNSFDSTPRAKLHESSPVLPEKVKDSPRLKRGSAPVTRMRRSKERPITDSLSIGPSCISSHSSLSSCSSEEKLHITRSEDGSGMKSTSGAPDLVMDLPVSTLSSSPKDCSSSSLSPPLTSVESYDDARVENVSSSVATSPELSGAMTAAECFAKQDQSTLKKTSSVSKPNTGAQSDAQTQTLLHETTVISSERTNRNPEINVAVQSSKDVNIEIRAAAELAPPIIAKTPTTPRLAERYLQAVAQSGGDSAVAVTPRVKPQVLKKPSLSQVLQDSSTGSP